MSLPVPTRDARDAPTAHITVVPPDSTETETLRVGPVRIDVLEDGRNTDRRLACVRITVPPGTEGPVEHWHQMHDETFHVLSGTATFTSLSTSTRAGPGTFVSVPPLAPHTFANDDPHDELVMLCTMSPAFYVDYFRLLHRLGQEGKVNADVAREVMGRYATLQVGEAVEY